MSAPILPSVLYAALCRHDGEELPVRRAPVLVNRTTLPAYGQAGALLYAPSTWLPAPGLASWAGVATVRLYPSSAPEADLVAYASAPIPASELPPSRALPEPAQPFTLPGGVLALAWAP